MGKLVCQGRQVGGIGSQYLHVRKTLARKCLRKGALAAVERPSPLAGTQRRQHPELGLLQKPPGKVAGDAAELFPAHGMVAPEHRQRCQHQRPAAQRRHTHAQHCGQHRQHPAHHSFVCCSGKGVCKTGVFCHGERCHRKARKRPFQHKCQNPQHTHAGCKTHTGAQGKIGQKIAAQPDDRKGTAMGVF